MSLFGLGWPELAVRPPHSTPAHSTLQLRTTRQRARPTACSKPAAVFTLAPYSEAPYALLSLAGMLLLERRRPTAAAALFGASPRRPFLCPMPFTFFE